MAMKMVTTQESINPNIIPMIDIMFLILLFFMLSADMGNRELEEVILPLANDVKEDKDDDAKARPITVNCVALIDIIFCLCIFFMCSFHFKQLEGKIDSWLPKDKGVHGNPVTNPVLEEMRVIMKWNDESRSVETKLGARPVADDKELGD